MKILIHRIVEGFCDLLAIEAIIKSVFRTIFFVSTQKITEKCKMPPFEGNSTKNVNLGIFRAFQNVATNWDFYEPLRATNSINEKPRV